MSQARRAAVLVGTGLVALACGVALGAGPLSGGGNDENSDRGISSNSVLKPDDFLTTFAADAGAALAKDGLESSNAVIITLPDTPESAVDGVVDGLENAGATLTGTVALQGKLLASSNRKFAVGVAEQAAKLKADDESADYGVIGKALTKAYVGKESKELSDRQVTIGSAFVDAGLIGTTEAPVRSADLVVIISGSHTPAGGEKILTEFVRQFSTAARGVVVAGPSSTSQKGYLAAIREADVEASTFDVVESPAGQRAVALVAIEAIAGKTGAYGSGEADDGPYPR